MTVGEFIEKLKKSDPDREIYMIEFDRRGNQKFIPINSIDIIWFGVDKLLLDFITGSVKTKKSEIDQAF